MTTAEMSANLQLIPWQQKQWKLLKGYIDQERIPQALLITGASGIGKSALATQFATALLCTDRQHNGFCCGRCSSCLLVKADSHPDLLYIRPAKEKQAISINQVRQLIADTYLKPQYESHRVIIIDPAQAMTLSAANAFLKCLEEPTDRTAFILITDRPNKLPATILSRCQRLPVTFPEPQILADWLKGQGIDDNQGTWASLLKNAIFTLPHVANPTILKQRADCFHDWLGIAKHKKQPAIIAEEWQKLPITDLMNWLISWSSDLIKCSFGVNYNYLCNQDFVLPLQELAEQLDLRGIHGLYDHLLVGRQQLGTPINIQLMLEEILIQWQGLNGRS